MLHHIFSVIQLFSIIFIPAWLGDKRLELVALIMPYLPYIYYLFKYISLVYYKFLLIYFKWSLIFKMIYFLVLSYSVDFYIVGDMGIDNIVGGTYFHSQ